MAFPTNPSPGDSYTDEYGTVWIYAGTVNGWYRQTVTTPNDTNYSATISGSGGPAGSDTQVQFNDNGVFAGDSGLTYNKTTDALSGGAFIPTGSTVPGNGIYLPSVNNVALSTNGTERARIDSSGRLLVGTSSSSTYGGITPQLQLSGSNENNSSLSLHRSNGSPYLILNTGATSGTVGNIDFNGYDGTSAYIPLARISGVWDGTGGVGDGPGCLIFSTTPDGSSSPTERMRITNTGVLWFGTTSGAINSTNFGVVVNNNNVNIAKNRAANNSVLNVYGSAGQFRTMGDGDVENTNNSYGAISDVKLKENIVDAESQWSDLKSLQVRKYNFKQETGYRTHTQIGLVAQEVETVSPGLVLESPDTDENGNDLGTVTKRVNYSVLYMKAVKALQEAMERIENLEAKIAALESA